MRWYIVETPDGDWDITESTPWKQRTFRAPYVEQSLVYLHGLPYVVNPKRFRKHTYTPRFRIKPRTIEIGLWRENEPEQVDFMDPKLRSDDITGKVVEQAIHANKIRKLLEPERDLKMVAILMLAVALIGAIVGMYQLAHK